MLRTVFAAALVAAFLVSITGCQNAGTVEFTQMESAVVPITMSAPGKVKITVSSDVQLMCFWADKQLYDRISSGNFLSPHAHAEAISSHVVSQGKRTFSETVSLPAGEVFISIQASGQAGYRVSADYSIEKL